MDETERLARVLAQLYGDPEEQVPKVYYPSEMRHMAADDVHAMIAREPTEKRWQSHMRHARELIAAFGDLFEASGG